MAAPVVSIRVVSLGPVGEASYFDIYGVSGQPSTLFPSSGTMYDGWCLDPNVSISSGGLPGTTYQAYVYSSYETGVLSAGIPSLGNPNGNLQNLGAINWLLNNYTLTFGAQFSYGEFQYAIWRLMGEAVGSPYRTELTYDTGIQEADITTLVNQALANKSFVPDVGQKIGVILDPFTIVNGVEVHAQTLIIETLAAKLGDFVWHDVNANGKQDSGEQGIAGAQVNLVRDLNNDGDFADANEVLATTSTDATGFYSFKGLTPGLTYQVQFTLPNTYNGISPRQADGSAGSGSNSDGLLSNVIVLAPGEFNRTIDAGFYKYASLGDRVWSDADDDGVQDAGEAGVANVIVILRDANGNQVATTTTDANGDYHFTGLVPSTYSVEFVKPDGYVFSGQDQGGDDAKDSDADTTTGKTVTTVLESGENDLSWDAGLVKLASLGDKVFEDKDADGVQDAGEAGIDGVKVKLYNCVTNELVAETTTAGGGLYNFEGLKPGTYHVVFETPNGYVQTTANVGGDDAADSDAVGGVTGCYTLNAGDNNTTVDAGFYKLASLGDYVWADNNNNGQQDDGANAGVAGVTVNLLRPDGTQVATTTTDATGYYLFSDLVPGDYKVEFVKPAGYAFSSQDQGADGSDSDADTATGLTVVTTLESGENDLSWDAGLVKLASLGDKVFEDKDADGVQDAGEAGIDGVKVKLYNCVTNELVAETTTAGGGLYNFEGLKPGTYHVVFETPNGYVQTTANVGGDDAADSDAVGGVTGCYTLNAGDNNTTVDAGFYKLASLGDYVWADNNNNGQQDDGANAGVAGVTVNLLRPDGTQVATTTTDATGYYLFSDLVPGDYKVEFVKPAGYAFSAKDQGADGSDSDADTATGLTVVTTLESGENDLSWDAGLVKLASLGDKVFEDKDADGVQDAGEAGIDGVKVKLYNCVTNE
ncbi:MAG: carboxypeptidase regulatory-like domain-containing protein, partial [Burkholderiaceae bacterium]|nr:carboxypeptidase regulatory-like domain-containing protein [Burkholderiaceae bacterium]